MPPTDTPNPDFAGRKVLIVDDDRLNLRILARILKPEGLIVEQVYSGEDALTQYDIFKPDLVLMDVMMPGISGFEACRTLRSKYGVDMAPVIFITAKTESDDVVEGLAAGGVDYLPKPFRGREALARLRVHLQNRILVEEQKKLVAQLSTANASKNKLLGMVAHDLRNPLVTVRGMSEFLKDDGVAGKLTADQIDLVDNIYTVSQSMLEMVNELLDVSVIESGELKVHPKPISLSEVLDRSVTLNNINAAKKGSRVTLKSVDLPPSLNLDGPKIKQVVDNLITNAIKFSPPNSMVTIEASQTPEACAVAVLDNGPGIPEDEMHKLFKDFSRTSVAPTAGEKSTGLGLAICRKIIEAHGGTIRADNRPGGGCTFLFTIPKAA
jgi:two-component system, sensor histidine kinase and response regulator